MTATCEPIFKLLWNKNHGLWNEECQETFEKINQYLQNPLLSMPPIFDRPLILYLRTTKKAMRCVLGQHDEFGKKKRAIYYLSKKFTDYESRLQWYISFIVHLYGLQNDFDSTCCITLHDWFQNWINTNSFISKNTKKISRISFNIGLYTYTVRYRPNIKNTWFFMKLQII